MPSRNDPVVHAVDRSFSFLRDGVVYKAVLLVDPGLVADVWAVRGWKVRMKVHMFIQPLSSSAHALGGSFLPVES